MYLGGAGTLCVVIFSIYLATFPGEWVKMYLPGLSSLQALLFEGDVDRVSGRPRSVFSNRLVLTNQSFVVDPEKLDNITVSHFFRGRDLRLAVLSLTDLRKADFTGAQLQGAELAFAQLQGASLEGAQLQGARLDRAQLQGARLDEAQLQGASLVRAQLQGASLEAAQLQGARLSFAGLQRAFLERAQLQGAGLAWAQLQGARLDEAQLQGAELYQANLHGGSLSYAQLQGASLVGAELQGAWLPFAQLEGASLEGAKLQGAWLSEARLQGASLVGAQLQGARLAYVRLWRAFGTPNLDLADLDSINSYERPWGENGTFDEWRDAIEDSVPEGDPRDQVIKRLAALDPTEKREPKDWDTSDSSQPHREEVWRKRAVFLADLACSGVSAPDVARGLIRNLQHKDVRKFFEEKPKLPKALDDYDSKLLDAGGKKLFTDRLLKGKTDATTCPGVRGFTDTDWANLSELGSEPPISR